MSPEKRVVDLGGSGFGILLGMLLIAFAINLNLMAIAGYLARIADAQEAQEARMSCP